MKLNWKKTLLAIAGLALCTAGRANAASFVNVQILGNTDGSATYASYSAANPLIVTQGQTVYFEVVGQLAGSGVQNATKPYTLATQVAGTDGINSLPFDLNATGTGTFQTAVLSSAYTQGTGAGAGAIGGSSVTNNFAAQAPGVYAGATSNSVILTGTFSAGSDLVQAIAASFTLGGTGGVKANTTAGQKLIQLTSNPGTETGSDPYVGFTALSLATAVSAVPAPAAASASIAMLALISGAGLLKLKRRQQLA